MNTVNSFKEPKKHGSSEFAFEIYDISSKLARQFAINHWHEETEIIYIEEGSLNISINGKIYTGSKGDIFTINSGDMHEICGLSAPISYKAFVFDFKMLSFKEEDFSEKKFISPVLRGELKFQSCLLNEKSYFLLLKKINDLNFKKTCCHTLLTKALLLEFFSKLIEEQKFSEVDIKFKKNEKTEFLKEIIKYINENFNEDITLKMMAARFNMSYKYFCRFFKNNFNKTFIEYLNEIRIENAIQLLSSGTSITDAAFSCGFSNISYFIKIFKCKTGLTPSRYKKI